MHKKINFLFVFFATFFLWLFFTSNTYAFDLKFSLNLIYGQSGEILINYPEISQFFYDELKNSPRKYLINSDEEFNLNASILVPQAVNKKGRYFAKLVQQRDGKELEIAELSGSVGWSDFYSEFDREWYFKGPELRQTLSAGNYILEIYSEENKGRYVLNIGENKVFEIKQILNSFWQLPWMKMTFSGTGVEQFFMTPSGIIFVSLVGGFLIFIAFIYYLIGFVRKTIKENEAKTLLLTSSGMQEMKDEIKSLLQKPAYNVLVAFITTASKPEQNKDYVENDLLIMKEDFGFNIEEFDVDGKTEEEVMRFLEPKDIIFVEGGNTFYLLNAMRKCNFEKVIRKLLKLGKVYIGASAGSIVAGRTIQTAGWGSTSDENFSNLKDLKGLGLVPFDIFVHYQPEYAEIIKQKIANPKKRAKNLRIITNSQAILVQGKEVDLIGDGEEIVV
jgi:dipeptidase E